MLRCQKKIHNTISPARIMAIIKTVAAFRLMWVLQSCDGDIQTNPKTKVDHRMADTTTLELQKEKISDSLFFSIYDRTAQSQARYDAQRSIEIRDRDVVFLKSPHEVTKNEPFSRTIIPIVEPLHESNMTFEEQLAYQELKAKRAENDTLTTKTLENAVDSALAKQAEKHIGIILNGNANSAKRSWDSLLNPQQLLVIDEKASTITRYPVSMWKRWFVQWLSKHIHVPPGKTVAWNFEITSIWPVNEGYQKSPEDTADYRSATHSWIKKPYRLSSDTTAYQWNAAMLYQLIALDPYVSMWVGIFIHGTQARKKIWLPASKGCIRMLPEHENSLLWQVYAGIAFQQNDTDSILIENNKRAFGNYCHTVVSSGNVQIKLGTPVIIVSEKEK